MSDSIASKKFAWLFSDAFLLYFVCFLMFGKRLWLLDYQINPEEGKEILQALDILKGKVIYRDFFAQYGPAGPYFTAMLYKLTGDVNLILPRLAVSVLATFTAFFSYRIARYFVCPGWAFWAALMSCSGLASRESTYGHAFAFLGMIASLYFLLSYFNKDRSGWKLVIAGFFVLLALLSKPVVFGIGAVLVGVFCLGLGSAIFRENEDLKSRLWLFLTPCLLPSLAVYGSLLALTPLETFAFSFNPLNSGTQPTESYYWKPLLPPIPYLPLGNWIADLNFYLVDPLRYWTVVLTFAGGVLFLLYSLVFRWKLKAVNISLVILLVYSLLIDAETLILIRRSVTHYVNLLPSYILLAILFASIVKFQKMRKPVNILAVVFCVFYFFYPALKIGWHYGVHGVPLELKYVESIQATPYQAESYRNTVQYIQQNTPANRPIVFVGFGSLVYLASERPMIFPEQYSIFMRTTPFLYRQKSEFYDAPIPRMVDQLIVDRMRSAEPSLLLIPASYMKENRLASSVLIQYIEQEWIRKDTLNADSPRGPFDWEEWELEAWFPRTT